MGKIILTGASGLLGSYLVPLLSPGNELHIISRLPVTEKSGNTVYHVYDLSANSDLKNLPDTADTLIYLAQSENYREFPAKALDIFQVNTAQVLRLLDYAIKAGIHQFVYASSGSVYTPGNSPVSERLELLANGSRGFYAATKLCTEIISETFAPYMNVTLLRFFFIYGKNQKRSMLLPRLVDNIQTGKIITLEGTEGMAFNPVHASDAAQAVKAALGLSGFSKINIAGPEALTLRSVCNVIGERLHIKPNFQFMNKIPQNLIADISEMNHRLVSPTCTFTKGVVDLL